MKLIFKKYLPIILAISALIAINLLASTINSQYDLTSEKRYTISKAVKQQLKNINEPITANIVLQKGLQKDFTRLAQSTENILRLFKKYAKGNINFKFVEPEDIVEGMNSVYADTLQSMGYYAINLKSQLKQGEEQQLIYPFILLQANDIIYPISLFDGNSANISSGDLNNATAALEYNLAQAIHKITATDFPIVAYEIGHGEPLDGSIADLKNGILQQSYFSIAYNIKSNFSIPDSINTLLIVKPKTTFNDEDKFKLDQFVMKGGKVIIFADKLNAETDSLQIKNQVIAFDRGLNLDDLLFKYGIKVNTDLVMDLQCDVLPMDVNGQGQFELLHWNYFPVFQSKNNHPINKNIGMVVSKFANSIETIALNDIQQSIILSSSANARTISSPALISGKENVLEQENANFIKANIPVGVLSEGIFTSLYANRLTPSLQDSLNKYNQQLVAKSNAKGKFIYIADGDIPLNSFLKGQPLPMGVNQYTASVAQKAFTFSNKQFVENILSYATDSLGIMQARNKDFKLRQFDKVMMDEQKTKWQFVNIALPLLFIFGLTILNLWWRKRKYA